MRRPGRGPRRRSRGPARRGGSIGGRRSSSGGLPSDADHRLALVPSRTRPMATVSGGPHVRSRRRDRSGRRKHRPGRPRPVPANAAIARRQCRQRRSIVVLARRRTAASAPRPIAIARKVREVSIRTHLGRLFRSELHACGRLNVAPQGAQTEWVANARASTRALFMRIPHEEVRNLRVPSKNL